MSEKTPSTPAGMKFAGGLVLFVLVAFGLMKLPSPPAPRDQAVKTRTTGTGSTTTGTTPATGTDGVTAEREAAAREENKPQTYSPTGYLASPGMWIEVHDPQAVKAVWDRNAWAKEARESALGRGFLGSWAALLGSRAEDLKTQLKGALADVLLSEVLTRPFRVVWFKGHSSRGEPALIMDDPPSSARRVLEALKAVNSTEVTAERCPAISDEEPAANPDGGPAVIVAAPVQPSGPFTMHTINIAQTRLWTAWRDNQLILGTGPSPVLTALCTTLPPMQQHDGLPLDVAVMPTNLGREPEVLSEVLGLGPVVRMGFAVVEDALAPRGLWGGVKTPGRLAEAAASENLMKLVPESTGVALLLNLRLPRELTREALLAAWKGAIPADAVARQVTMVMDPRADALEAALLWGRPEDKDALHALFSVDGGLVRGEACGHVILATSDGMLQRLEQTCAGKLPNMGHAAGPVVNGFKAPSAMQFSVHAGRVLWQLTEDGYAQSGGRMGKDMSAEMKEAQRLLEALPVVGMKARLQGQALVGEGFRS
ncbi:MAG: hypothetical protein AB2A00_10905 [Myxococcota bacterium]